MDNRKKKLMMMVLLLAGCLATSLLQDFFSKNEREDAAAAEGLLPLPQQQQKMRTIKIYVSGAVAAPGLYALPEGARAWEAVEAAGGMLAEANWEKVNLARKLKDGYQVNVPAVKVKASGKSTAGSREGSNFSAAVSSSGKKKINLNSASIDELDRLPGIGPATAARIIEYRKGRRFTAVDDLLQVKGIGKAKLAKLRGFVEVN